MTRQMGTFQDAISISSASSAGSFSNEHEEEEVVEELSSSSGTSLFSIFIGSVDLSASQIWRKSWMKFNTARWFLYVTQIHTWQV